MEDYDDMLDVLKQMQDAHPTSDAGTKTYAFFSFKDWDGSYMKIPNMSIVILRLGRRKRICS